MTLVRQSNYLELRQGDSLEVLRELPDQSVQCCITSPPYWGLRDYGTAKWEGGDAECDHKPPDEAGKATKPSDGQREHAGRFAGPICWKCGAKRIDAQLGLEKTPEEYVEKMVEIFREIRRVLRDDGTLWLNMGDCYASKPPGNLGDYSSSGLHHDGRPTPMTPKYAETLRSSVGQKRNTVIGDLKPKDLVGMPWRLAFALQVDGWYLRSDIIWSKPNPMPESVRDRPTKAHEYLFLLSKKPKYYYDANAIREPLKEPERIRSDQVGGNKGTEVHHSPGGTYDQNVHKTDKQRGHGRRHAGFNDRWDQMTREEQMAVGSNKRTVWTIATQPYAEAHFATFPEKLIEPCILAGTSEKGCCPACGAPWRRVVDRKFVPQADVSEEKGIRAHEGQKPMDESSSWSGSPRGMTSTSTAGWQPSCSCPLTEPVPCTVLDPFMGSGTTGIVALKNDRKFLGIELNPKYINDLALPRLIEQEKRPTAQFLFSDPPSTT